LQNEVTKVLNQIHRHNKKTIQQKVQVPNQNGIIAEQPRRRTEEAAVIKPLYRSRDNSNEQRGGMKKD